MMPCSWLGAARFGAASRRWGPSLGRGFLSWARPRAAPRDAYSILGLDRSATQDEVKERFRELAKQYHPDLNRGDRSASMKMAELTGAYDTLMDARKRAALDQAVAGSHGFTAGATPRTSGFAKGAEWSSPP